MKESIETLGNLPLRKETLSCLIVMGSVWHCSFNKECMPLSALTSVDFEGCDSAKGHEDEC